MKYLPLIPLLLLSLNVSAARERHLPEGNYNVLFIPIDDFRVLIDAYGETEPLRPITPNMDRLTRQGVSFSNAYCQQAVCNASRASLMTGLRPDTTRCWKLQTFFRDTVGYDLKTLPQHFSEQGYSTHGIGKIYHSTNSTKQDDNPTGSRSWNDGWDETAKGAHTWYEAGKAEKEDAGVKKVSATDAGEFDRSGNPITDEAYDDGAASAAGVAKIAGYASDYEETGTPFFLAVGFKKPHLPFNCPKKYWDLYDPAEIDLAGYDGSHDMPDGTNRFTAPYGGEPAAFIDIDGHPETKAPGIDDARHLIHGYLACASFIDAQVGKLLTALEDPDGNPDTDDSVLENTIVILWSDHGFFLGEHNGFWAKHANYEISTRVPLIVRAPGMTALGSAGRFCPAPVELVDIYPTLVDICSLPDPEQPPGMAMQGTSFLPLLEDPRQPWKKAAFSQYQRNINARGSGDVPVAHSGSGMGYSIRTSRYRYTEWWRTVSSDQTLDLHELVHSSPEHVELYDHSADPNETINLAAQPAYAELVEKLSALLNDPDSRYAGDGWKQTIVDAPAEFPMDHSSWSQGYETPGVPEGSLDPFLDPDVDGWLNIFEYKFGTHPLEADKPEIRKWVQENSLVLAYPEIISRSGVNLQVFSSNNLHTGPWTTSHVTVGSAGSVGNATILKASSPITSNPLFVRLQAQLLP